MHFYQEFHKNDVVHHSKRFRMLRCFITSDIYIVKLVSAGFLCCKITVSYSILVSFMGRVLFESMSILFLLFCLLI